MDVIVTLPAYADYVEQVVARPIVSAVRFNTVLPVREGLEEFLEAFQRRVAPKDLWVDLKCRQLRVTRSAYVPYDYLDISHAIRVKTPTKVTFCSGEFSATIREVVGGTRLIIEDVPPLPLGSGMSLSIPDPSLEIEGYMTEADKAFVRAANCVGIHRFMLSYVEGEQDLLDLLEMDPKAKIVAKIESAKGLEFVEGVYPRYRSKVRLMAARGDLFNELGWPHEILRATKTIVARDRKAVGASRIFSSMRKARAPQCAELGDVGFLLEAGYKTLMLGDEVCFQKESVLSALAVLEAVERDYCRP